MRLIVAVLVAAAGLAFVPAPAEAVTCKSYSNCAQAVANWCAGRHPRADRDKDGIPCENVCPSRRVVDAEKRRIGCSR